MREAAIPLVATALLAFAVHRWAADELERERRLSSGAARATLAFVFLHAALVLVSSLGGVLAIDVPRSIVLPGGIALSALGAVVAVGALVALGSRERALAMRADVVVTRGPYRYARHPFYIGWTLALLGVALAGRSGLALGLVALLAIALVRIARGEERWLSDELGEPYDRYRRQAPGVLGRARLSTPA